MVKTRLFLTKQKHNLPYEFPRESQKNTIAMKSICFALFLVLSCTCLFAQTDADERAALSKKMLSAENPDDDLSKIGLKWSQFLAKYGKYPDLPLDPNGNVRYTYTREFKQVSKEQLFNRTLEWFAINYAIYPSGMYSCLNDGKIILNNTFTIDGTYSCSYTCIISAKNEKVLVEIFNINYQGFFQGHYSNDNWMPDRTINFSINQIFPVVLKDTSEWKFNLNLLKAVNEHLQNNLKNLEDYLLNYEAYNRF